MGFESNMMGDCRGLWSVEGSDAAARELAGPAGDVKEAGGASCEAGCESRGLWSERVGRWMGPNLGGMPWRRLERLEGAEELESMADGGSCVG